MRREWTIKSFQSGNSVAWRVPAAAGVAPSEEWRLVEDGDGFRLAKADRPKRKFDIDKVAGSAKSLRLIDPSDRWFEERPLYGRDFPDAAK